MTTGEILASYPDETEVTVQFMIDDLTATLLVKRRAPIEERLQDIAVDALLKIDPLFGQC